VQTAAAYRAGLVLTLGALLPLALGATGARAQTTPAQQPAGQQSTSQQPTGQQPAGQPTGQRPTSQSGRPLPPPPTIDTNVNANETLADVHYDNKWEVYGGAAFSHFRAGPNLIGGTNLGGFDVQGTRWLRPRLGATANVRGYYGTQSVDPNPDHITGPFVMEHLFLGGGTYRALQNPHAAVDFHGLVGGGYGDFQHALSGVPPNNLGLFSNGGTFAMALGGSLDLNRSPRLALRISPDYILTRYGGFNQNEFAISVGILYRIGIPKRAVRR
jgi:hypothetical protein